MARLIPVTKYQLIILKLQYKLFITLIGRTNFMYLNICGKKYLAKLNTH